MLRREDPKWNRASAGAASTGCAIDRVGSPGIQSAAHAQGSDAGPGRVHTAQDGRRCCPNTMCSRSRGDCSVTTARATQRAVVSRTDAATSSPSWRRLKMSCTVAAEVPPWRRYRSTMACEPTSSSNAPMAQGFCQVGSRPIGRSAISSAAPRAPRNSLSSMRRPSPAPVPSARNAALLHRLAHPSACSPSIARFTSFSIATCGPKRPRR